MAVVVRWRADGEYLSGLRMNGDRPEAVWTTDRRAAMRFDSQTHAKRAVAAHFGDSTFCGTGQTRFVRLKPKRRVERSSAAPIPGAPGEYVSRHAGVTISAPETMTLGEVWSAILSRPEMRVCLNAEIRNAAESALAKGRDAGSAEMRERAAAVLDRMVRAAGPYACGTPESYSRLAEELRALPLSVEPQTEQSSGGAEISSRWRATTEALWALGVPFDRAALAGRIAEDATADHEAAHRACIAIAKADGARLFCDDATELRDRIREMVTAERETMVEVCGQRPHLWTLANSEPDARPPLAAGQTWRDTTGYEIPILEERDTGGLFARVSFGRINVYEGDDAPVGWTFVHGPGAPNPGASEVRSADDAGGGP